MSETLTSDSVFACCLSKDLCKVRHIGPPLIKGEEVRMKSSPYGHDEVGCTCATISITIPSKGVSLWILGKGRFSSDRGLQLGLVKEELRVIEHQHRFGE